MADIPASLSEVASARETCADQFDRMLNLYDQLDSKLATLESGSSAADNKLNELYDTLAGHLNGTKIASTASSAVAIIGTILWFTPAAPLGIALTIGGAVGGIATSATEHFVFEKDAADGFKEAINKYTITAQALQDLFQDIKDVEGKMDESLTKFLALLSTRPMPTPAGNQEKLSDPKMKAPKLDYATNGFSQIALHGLFMGTAGAKPLTTLALKGGTQLSESLGKSGGVLLKALPAFKAFGKALPLVGIAIEAGSIISTWTMSNETLELDKKLKNEISSNTAAVREAVRKYKSSLEEQIGNSQLQQAIRKLLRLRKSPPPGPPPSEQAACAMLAAMDLFKNSHFWIFARLLGDDHEDGTKNEYGTELIARSEVEDLSRKPLCAPVVDSVFAHYPDIEDKDDSKPEDQPGHHALQSGGSTSTSFRADCGWANIGNSEVYNVSGTKKDKRRPSWINFWKSFWYGAVRGGCVPQLCKILEPGSHSVAKPLVGGHLQVKIDGTDPDYWYILPICPAHNAPSGTYDWGRQVMLTKQVAWAVEIPAVDF